MARLRANRRVILHPGRPQEPKPREVDEIVTVQGLVLFVLVLYALVNDAGAKEAIANQAPWVEVARALNRTVWGWANYFSYGSVSKARHGVDRHLYHSARNFLRRRHKVAGSGYRQFPAHRVFGELGVVSFDPTYRRRAARASM
jgi:hypothetical protein